jgi:hypothetical protein
LPAPIANNDSVAVADNETIRCGGFADEAEPASRRSPRRATSRSFDTNPPFREGFDGFRGGRQVF